MTGQTSPQLLRFAQAADAGETEYSLGKRVAQRKLIRLRPGAFVEAADFSASYREVQHRLLIEAAFPKFSQGTVLSHQSAAILHGLPLWGIPTDRVHVTKQRRSGGHLADGLHTHSAPMDDFELSVVDDFAVTALARTVVDVARSSPFEQGVVVADAALHRGLVTKTELADTVALASKRQGVSMAHRVVAFADGRSESVGESRSRVLMHQAGLPTPELQWEVRNNLGVVVARTDFGLPEHRWVGEFDGFVKYGRLLRTGESPSDAVFREKRREDLVRDENLRMLRWTWPELDNPQQLIMRFRASLDRCRSGSVE